MTLCGGHDVKIQELRYGSGGCFLAREDLGRMFDHSFPACVFFLFVFFFEVEIGSRALIPLFIPGSVHVSQRAETTVAECSLTSCV